MVTLPPPLQVPFFAFMNQSSNAIREQIEIGGIRDIRFHHERIATRFELVSCLMPRNLLTMLDDQQVDFLNQFGSQEIDVLNPGGSFLFSLRFEITMA